MDNRYDDTNNEKRNDQSMNNDQHSILKRDNSHPYNTVYEDIDYEEFEDDTDNGEINFTMVGDNTSENGDDNNQEGGEQTTADSYYQVKPEDIQNDNQPSSKGKRGKFFTRKALAFTLAGCILLSGVVGFGGGYAAVKLAGNNTSTMYQSVERTSSTTSSTASNDGTMTTEEIAESAGNSVVEIKTKVQSTGGFMGSSSVQEGAGSGVIVTSDGYIVTNNHVIDGASKVSVTLKSGDSYDAEVIGTDEQTDIAVLKIEASDLQPVVMGDSSELKVGEKAVAIGNPLGELGGTVTEGIISALDREITLDGETMNLLQTNAEINPGNSGGGLFNKYGELVGVVVAKSSGEDVEGLGFAIPINDVKEVIESLSSYGYVKGRPAMGVSLADITSSEAAMQYRVNELGVYVAEVTSGSGAEKAGMQVGDRIISVDGQEINSVSDLRAIVNNHQVGDSIAVQVKRNNQTTDLKITLGESMKQ